MTFFCPKCGQHHCCCNNPRYLRQQLKRQTERHEHYKEMYQELRKWVVRLGVVALLSGIVIGLYIGQLLS